MTTHGIAGPLHVYLKRFSLDIEELEARLARNPREAANAIREAAERGSDAAQLILGQLLLDGRGVARDPSAALAWFERAAEQGNVEARNMVGRCHERGWGVPQDYGLAAGHFEQAIAGGHVWAKVNLAQILMRLGDPAQRPRAYELFRRSAEEGNLKAINSLARFVEEGWVVPADPARAAELYRIAAERGDHWAKFNLATILLASGERGQALTLIDDAIGRSDAGFRRRVAPCCWTGLIPNCVGLAWALLRLRQAPARPRINTAMRSPSKRASLARPSRAKRASGSAWPPNRAMTMQGSAAVAAPGCGRAWSAFSAASRPPPPSGRRLPPHSNH
jgi:TPR repeat protein